MLGSGVRIPYAPPHDDAVSLRGCVVVYLVLEGIRTREGFGVKKRSGESFLADYIRAPQKAGSHKDDREPAVRELNEEIRKSP